MTHRVWVGAAGSTTGWGVIQSIRERWPGVAIVAADTHPRPLVAAAAEADAFVQVPSATEPGFASALATGLLEHDVDTYVPIHDLELIAAARAREQGLLPRGIACTAPAPAVAELCWDKLALAAALDGAGLPTPRTAVGSAPWAGPCAVKPRRGVGSRDARVLDDAGERTPAERSDAFVVQERCLPPEITVDVFRSRDGRCFASAARERVDVRAGVTTTGRVHFDAELDRLARLLASAIGLVGAFCFQVMRAAGEDGGWRITDVNPRPGGATRMSVALGVDVHAAMLADAWGDDPARYVRRLDGERWVTRGYVERVAQR